jgi:purine-binding chemotaxis protein CheW
MTNPLQFCTFYLHKYLFGIELLRVQEVLQKLELTEVPLAPFEVRALMNLRGQIVTAVDLRRRLALPERAAEQIPMHVVVRDGDEVVSLLVDEIGDVVEVAEDTFEAPPETLRGAVRSAILGVHKLDKQLLHVLDTDRICETAQRGESATPAS